MLDATQLEQMILDGSAEVAGLDPETGEFLYSFTPKVAELHPELYTEMTDFYYSGVVSLWQKGFLDVNMDSADPYVKLNDNSLDPDKIKTLSSLEKRLLESVIAKINETSG
jgi:hypothetical protein